MANYQRGDTFEILRDVCIKYDRSNSIDATLISPILVVYPDRCLLQGTIICVHGLFGIGCTDLEFTDNSVSQNFIITLNNLEDMINFGFLKQLSNQSITMTSTLTRHKYQLGDIVKVQNAQSHGLWASDTFIITNRAFGNQNNIIYQISHNGFDYHFAETDLILVSSGVNSTLNQPINTTSQYKIGYYFWLKGRGVYIIDNIILNALEPYYCKQCNRQIYRYFSESFLNAEAKIIDWSNLPIGTKVRIYNNFQRVSNGDFEIDTNRKAYYNFRSTCYLISKDGLPNIDFEILSMPDSWINGTTYSNGQNMVGEEKNKCLHPRKYLNVISASLKFWSCPDCKCEVKE